jgi:hypothetical protein
MRQLHTFWFYANELPGAEIVASAIAFDANQAWRILNHELNVVPAIHCKPFQAPFEARNAIRNAFIKSEPVHDSSAVEARLRGIAAKLKTQDYLDL